MSNFWDYADTEFTDEPDGFREPFSPEEQAAEDEIEYAEQAAACEAFEAAMACLESGVGGGTFFAGVGKEPGSPRGQYVETWITTGSGGGEYSGRGNYLWYMLKAIQTGRFKRTMTAKEIADAEDWFRKKRAEG